MRWRNRLALAVWVGLTVGGCAEPSGSRFLTASRDRWQRVGPIRHFTADNLYDHINGEADTVIPFGFRSLANARYQHGAETKCTVDIYDMGSASNAFALFRSHADLEAKPLDVGSEAVGDQTRTEFWQGSFYVDVVTFSPTEGFSALTLARDLARSLPPTKAWPAYLKLLPTRGRVARSEQYVPHDLFGRSFLNRAITARYKLGTRKAMLFACRYDSPKGAARALDRFEAILRQKRPTRPVTLGERGFLADDPVLGRLVVFRRAHFVAGMTGYAKDPATEALLADFDRCLRGH
jgi:hypothetical protein